MAKQINRGTQPMAQYPCLFYAKDGLLLSTFPLISFLYSTSPPSKEGAMYILTAEAKERTSYLEDNIGYIPPKLPSVGKKSIY